MVDPLTPQTPKRPMRLGDRLLSDGLISEKQLKTALGEQRRTGSTLGEVLVSSGFVQEETLARILAESQGIPFVELSQITPEEDLLEAIGPEFARKHGVFPLDRRDGVVRLAMANPGDILAIDAVEQHLWRTLEIVAASRRDIYGAISRYLEKIEEEDHDEAMASRARAGSEEKPEADAIALCNQVIDAGLRNLATDIHIEPEEKLLRIRYRIDGILEQGDNLPQDSAQAILTRLKILAGLDITERRLPQDGRIKMTRPSGPVDMRVSIMPTNYGENAVIRVLDKSAVSVELTSLGLCAGDRARLADIVGQSNGMLLVSGPTGSGKSTTLYALLQSVDSLTRKIITIEDPIEYEQPLIRQSQVDTAVGYTFGAGLRAALRQDPDIILVGEIRDGETADIALKASLTGHLVLSSIHTNSAIGVVTRLLDLDIDRYLVASSMSGAVAQRLVRRICTHCREERPATPAEGLGLGLSTEGLMLFSGKGCSACRDTGYSGRLAVYEIFVMDAPSARIIAEGGGEHELNLHAQEAGVRTMADDAREKVLAGLTTAAEFMRVVPSFTHKSEAS